MAHGCSLRDQRKTQRNWMAVVHPAVQFCLQEMGKGTRTQDNQSGRDCASQAVKCVRGSRAAASSSLAPDIGSKNFARRIM